MYFSENPTLAGSPEPKKSGEEIFKPEKQPVMLPKKHKNEEWRIQVTKGCLSG